VRTGEAALGEPGAIPDEIQCRRTLSLASWFVDGLGLPCACREARQCFTWSFYIFITLWRQLLGVDAARRPTKAIVREGNGETAILLPRESNDE